MTYKYRQLERDVDEAKKALLACAQHTKALLDRAKEEAPWSQYETIFESMPEQTQAELRARIENNQNALDYFRGDRRVVETYERVKAEIESEERNVANMMHNQETLMERIHAIKVQTKNTR